MQADDFLKSFTCPLICFILLATPFLRMAQKPLTELWNRIQVQIQKILVTSVSNRSLLIRIGSSQHIIQLMAETFELFAETFELMAETFELMTET